VRLHHLLGGILGVWICASPLLAQVPVVVQTPINVVTPAPISATPVLQGIPFGATIPRVVRSVPANGAQNTNVFLRRIEIEFDQPMDVATFYWPVPPTTDFPFLTANPFWNNNNRTFILPVTLNAYVIYRIPINVNSQIVFRSAQGVPANPGYISFSTGDPNVGGSVPAQRFPGVTPNIPRPALRNTPRVVPTAPVFRQNSVNNATSPRNTATPSAQQQQQQQLNRAGNVSRATPARRTLQQSARGGGYSMQPHTVTPTPTPGTATSH
jgi:hypothetical protein